MTEEVSVFIINYNGEKVLAETIQSLKEQDFPIKSITLIDDGSADKSVSFVRKNFPEIEIIGLSFNTRFPNKLRRMALDGAKTRYIMLIDNDIALEPNCVTNLISAIKSEPYIGICTPQLMYYNDRNRIYVSWTKFHYLAVSISPLRDTFASPYAESKDTLGGGTMLLDRTKLDIVGTIDDSYPMGWGEDAEIYARMKIAGFKTVYVPSAIGYHHAKPFVTVRRPNAFGQARNRWFMVFSMYQLRTIILILPMLILYDKLIFLMLIPKKQAIPYVKGILRVFKNFKEVLRKRRQIQLTRKINDRDILTSGPIYIPGAYLTNPLIHAGFNYLNRIFYYYWKLVKPLI